MELGRKIKILINYDENEPLENKNTAEIRDYLCVHLARQLSEVINLFKDTTEKTHAEQILFPDLYGIIHQKEIEKTPAQRIYQIIEEIFNKIAEIYKKDEKKISEILDGTFPLTESEEFPLFVILDIFYSICIHAQIFLNAEQKNMYEQIIEKSRQLHFPSEYKSNWHINPEVIHRFKCAECTDITYSIIAAEKTTKYGSQDSYISTIKNYNRLFLIDQAEQLTEQTEQFLNYDTTKYPELECKNLYILQEQRNSYYGCGFRKTSEFNPNMILFQEQKEELEKKYNTLKRIIIQKGSESLKQFLSPFLVDDFNSFTLKEEYPWESNEMLKKMKSELKFIYCRLEKWREKWTEPHKKFTEAIQNLKFLQSISPFATMALNYYNQAKWQIVQELAMIYIQTTSTFPYKFINRKVMTKDQLEASLIRLSFIELQNIINESKTATYKNMKKIIKRESCLKSYKSS